MKLILKAAGNPTTKIATSVDPAVTFPPNTHVTNPYNMPACAVDVA